MLLLETRGAHYYLLLGSLMLWSILLFGGYALALAGGCDEIPTPARMGSSLVLVVAGWLWHARARTRGIGWCSLMIAIGMSLGFAGDLFMASLIPFGDHLLLGMGAFGLGHLCYIAAFIYQGSRLGYTSAVARFEVAHFRACT